MGRGPPAAPPRLTEFILRVSDCGGCAGAAPRQHGGPPSGFRAILRTNAEISTTNVWQRNTGCYGDTVDNMGASCVVCEGFSSQKHNRVLVTGLRAAAPRSGGTGGGLAGGEGTHTYLGSPGTQPDCGGRWESEAQHPRVTFKLSEQVAPQRECKISTNFHLIAENVVSHPGRSLRRKTGGERGPLRLAKPAFPSKCTYRRQSGTLFSLPIKKNPALIKKLLEKSPGSCFSNGGVNSHGSGPISNLWHRSPRAGGRQGGGVPSLARPDGVPSGCPALSLVPIGMGPPA